MFYKPNFCAHCGEKVERLAWMPWTSRRFCEICETELAHHEWLSRSVAIAISTMFLFSIGMLFGNSENSKVEKTGSVSTEIRPPIAANREAPALETQSSGKPVNAISAPKETKNSSLALKSAAQISANEDHGDQPSRRSAEAYYCGARTRKGTPCTRRVKNGGRCWQHAGLPSMTEETKSKAVASR